MHLKLFVAAAIQAARLRHPDRMDYFLDQQKYFNDYVRVHEAKQP